MTTTINATVYLNDTTTFRGRFGEGLPAQLREATRFTAQLPAGDPASAVIALLRTVFDELNVDDPSTEWAQQYRRDRNRSFSVGDVVVLGETAWACASFGWDSISAEQLRDALSH
ncbi:MAG: hypothetical protein E6R06_15965 [Mycobacterium sp.]|nr:MAG: hypothetical protein E6R06_15965 [Mycobacterium sp.]